MASFEEIKANFEFLDDWPSRYQYLIELGKALEGLPEAEKTPDKLVKGCMSQVWLRSEVEGGRLRFRADSDAFIVRGLLALLLSLYDDQEPAKIQAIDALAAFADLDLQSHLSPTRTNGLHAMIQRMKALAAAAPANHQG